MFYNITYKLENKCTHKHMFSLDYASVAKKYIIKLNENV